MTSADDRGSDARTEGVVTLDAVDVALLPALHDALCVPGLRVVVLRRTDVAIADLDEAVLAVARAACPVVAVVTGRCAGAAAALAVAADLRVLGTGAVLEVEPLAGGVAWTLPRAVGAAARGLLLLPRPVDADEALGLGLADVVAEDPTSAAHALAARLAARPGAWTAAAKRSLDDVDGLRAAIEREARLRAVVERADSLG